MLKAFNATRNIGPRKVVISGAFTVEGTFILPDSECLVVVIKIIFCAGAICGGFFNQIAFIIITKMFSGERVTGVIKHLNFFSPYGIR